MLRCCWSKIQKFWGFKKRLVLLECANKHYLPLSHWSAVNTQNSSVVPTTKTQRITFKGSCRPVDGPPRPIQCRLVQVLCDSAGTPTECVFRGDRWLRGIRANSSEYLSGNSGKTRKFLKAYAFLIRRAEVEVMLICMGSTQGTGCREDTNITQYHTPTNAPVYHILIKIV